MAILSNIVVYIGGYLSLVFVAVCLATGLYYLAEMVEEYTRVTKKVLTWAIKISVGLDVALLVVDRLPFLCIALSIGAQCIYHRLLRRFPLHGTHQPGIPRQRRHARRHALRVDATLPQRRL